MSKTKNWLIAAAVLLLTGCIAFVGVMMALKWDFSSLSTVQFESNSYQIDGGIRNISIKSDTADVVFVTSQDEYCSVICFEEQNAKHRVSAKDGALTIELVDSKKWYEHIGINTHTPKITISVPEGQYGMLTITESTGDIDIPKELSFEAIDISLSTGNVKNYASASSIKMNTTTGDIYTENISADSLEFSVSTGKVTARSVACKGELNIAVSTGDAIVTDVVCNALISTGSTGDMKLENVTAAESFSITRTTGDVVFQNCDAGALTIETDTGSVTGNLLSEKIFITDTSTGDVDVPKTTTGGICQISTSTGDIQITLS